MKSERQQKVAEYLKNAEDELVMVEDWIKATKNRMLGWKHCGYVNEDHAKQCFTEIEAAVEEAKHYVNEVNLIK